MSVNMLPRCKSVHCYAKCGSRLTRQCQWGYCTRADFANIQEFTSHLKKHCANTKPVLRSVYESQDSNESASYRPPRFDTNDNIASQSHASRSLGVDASALSSLHASSPPHKPVEAELHASTRYDDELAPPVLSAPPASIPLAHSQDPRLASPDPVNPLARNGISAEQATIESQIAAVGTQIEERDGAFMMHFSQMPGISEHIAGLEVDKSGEEVVTSGAHELNEPLAIMNDLLEQAIEDHRFGFSQVLDESAFTQA